MIDISVQNIKIAFQGVPVLEDITFDVHEGEHLALLGANGCGKTTLLRILTRELEADEGVVVIPSQKRIGLISQIPVFPDGYTVEDVLRSAVSHLTALSARMRALEEQMSTDPADAVMREYDRLTADYERLGGYSADYERDRVANGLNIPERMRQQPFEQLSGGEKTRVNLARLILENTDILLLDEPTNHLDLRSTEWLEEYITHFHGTVLAVSHDRWFMDTIARRTIEIRDGRCEFYSGNYSFYVMERQRRYDEMMKQYEKNRKEIAHLQEAADKLHLWAFLGADKLHKRAFSMEKRIEKLQTAPRPGKQKSMAARFAAKDFHGDEVLLCAGLKKSYGEKVLFENLDLLIEPGERIALMGDNGSGKSTLVRILLGELEADEGYLRRGPSVRVGYLPQIVAFANPNDSLLDTVITECRLTAQEARNRLAAFRFPGEDVFKPVSALSGGERSRLKLCILMKDELSLLVLDEPTNHLDIASREWMECALAEYKGTLLLVSHDRWLIDSFADRVWELDKGTLTDYRGGYEDYLAARERKTDLQRAEKRKAPKPATPKKPADTAKQLAKTEREIDRLEQQIRDLKLEEERCASDYLQLMAIYEQIKEAEEELDRLYEQWESLGG